MLRRELFFLSSNYSRYCCNVRRIALPDHTCSVRNTLDPTLRGMRRTARGSTATLLADFTLQKAGGTFVLTCAGDHRLFSGRDDFSRCPKEVTRRVTASVGIAKLHSGRREAAHCRSTMLTSPLWPSSKTTPDRFYRFFECRETDEN